MTIPSFEVPETVRSAIIISAIAFIGVLVSLVLWKLRKSLLLRGKRLASRALILAVALVMSVALLPAAGFYSEERSTMRSEQQLRQIALAITKGYAEDRKPLGVPRATFDKDGQWLLSWRVQILPYIGHEGLYRQFHHDEPWDSPHNVQLLQEMPALYRNPVWLDSPSDQTYFQVFEGGNTAFYGNVFHPDYYSRDDNVILITEGWKPVPWTKPADITITEPRTFGGARKTGFTARASRRPIVAAMTDGSVVTIRIDADPATKHWAIENTFCHLNSDW
jgi:hypothetical protein